MQRETGPFRQIRMFPEYGADLPLWDEGGLLDPEDLNISEGLMSRLRTWSEEWQSGPPEKPRMWSDKQLKDWKQRGYRLAGQLQAELRDTEVLVENDRGDEVPLHRIWSQD